jgi:hypothetical protein
VNIVPAVFLAALVVCVVVVIGILAYRSGRRAGNEERCNRHIHAERLAAGRTEPIGNDSPPSRVTDADFRHTLFEEGW